MSDFDLQEALETVDEARQRRIDRQNAVLEALGVDPEEIR